MPKNYINILFLNIKLFSLITWSLISLHLSLTFLSFSLFSIISLFLPHTNAIVQTPDSLYNQWSSTVIINLVSTVANTHKNCKDQPSSLPYRTQICSPIPPMEISVVGFQISEINSGGFLGSALWLLSMRSAVVADLWWWVSRFGFVQWWWWWLLASGVEGLLACE